jgi:hypothetical protein
LPERKLLLDLDRTLFDTPLFVQTLWGWIGKTYTIDAVASRENMKSYFSYVGDLYDYDFFSHVTELGIDTKDLVSRALHDLKGEDFIYNDVETFLENTANHDRAILTFGNDSYQRFKLSFCPVLKDIPVHTTQLHKSEYIQDSWSAQPVVLIDDKLLDGTLPDDTHFIQIDRSQGVAVVDHGTYKSVPLLTDIKKEWLL